MIGVIVYSISGRVMVCRWVKVLVLFIVVVLYRLFGIVCNMLVVMVKINGKLSQVCIMISVVLVQNGLVSYVFGLMLKKDRIVLLMILKELLNILVKMRMVINFGIVYGKIKMVWISGLKCRFFWFIRIVNNMFIVYCRVVVSSVYIMVYCSIFRKVECQMERVKILIKFFSFIQFISFVGGVWYRLQLVKVMVKLNRIGKIIINISRIKFGVIIRYGKLLFSSIWYCLCMLLRVIFLLCFLLLSYVFCSERKQISMLKVMISMLIIFLVNRKIELFCGIFLFRVYNFYNFLCRKL